MRAATTLLTVAALTAGVFAAPARDHQGKNHQGNHQGKDAEIERFGIVMLENTDYEVSMANPTLQKILSFGRNLDHYHGVTHPSEPNYLATIAGSYFGVQDDA